MTQQGKKTVNLSISDPISQHNSCDVGFTIYVNVEN